MGGSVTDSLLLSIMTICSYCSFHLLIFRSSARHILERPDYYESNIGSCCEENGVVSAASTTISAFIPLQEFRHVAPIRIGAVSIFRLRGKDAEIGEVLIVGTFLWTCAMC